MKRSEEYHYDENYFMWQRTVGEFGGKANLFKFEKYIGKNDDVLDFGCGGGFLLKNICTSGKKCGVEINPYARECAIENGAEVYERLSDMKDDSVDVIISNHALEHVENPWEIIREFKRVCRKGGKVIVVVPHETSIKVNLEDRDMHLYTWTPQNLVNLFRTCGYEILEFGRIFHKWPKFYVGIQKIFGWNIFHKLCKLYSHIRKNGYQTFVVGRIA